MLRLLPTPELELTVLDALAELRPWEQAPEVRPRVLSNFVHTLDGRIAIDGSSRAIGSETDTAMLVGLRTRVDAVMIGAGTMRAERYGRVIPDPRKRQAREANGLGADPLMVLVSGRLDLPWDAGLFSNGCGEILIITTSEDEPPETATPLSVIRHEGRIDFAAALLELREQRGIRALLCEGGPGLHGELIAHGVIDEMFVTHVPKLVGGLGPSLAGGLAVGDWPLQLSWLLHEPATGELFARYLVPAE